MRVEGRQCIRDALAQYFGGVHGWGLLSALITSRMPHPCHALHQSDAKSLFRQTEKWGNLSPWSERFPTVVAAWHRAWTRVVPFFAFSPDVRRVIYTTNAIESVHARLRKIIKTRGHFPSDQVATKLIWLALRNIAAEWSRTTREWKAAMNQFAILYEDRFTLAR